ncbi:hypothetical protein GCM10010116_03760 [Microbispora rosea subsp. aerata]|nr:DUF664 domain-containing protein [Microbispora rosea]GGO01982.1 hypothetical protein GCM10010116_03760 [Microbispora rosea subsp. aerata]GIH54723.1 hypothetical protein Mro02_16370 [Microbispora rosea subsp. aerata]GLJ86341.1 hypothetical protein GCM10017588_50770 [Microbispora rosea subsp. aerata]
MARPQALTPPHLQPSAVPEAGGRAADRPDWRPARPSRALAGTEAEHLVGALERLRATFRRKVDGLDSAGLRARIGASPLTLGGLLKHLAYVEEQCFGTKLSGAPLGAPWDARASLISEVLRRRARGREGRHEERGRVASEPGGGRSPRPTDIG